jgi:hypothetical protein
MVVIRGFAVTATVMVTGPDADPDPDPDDPEHAVNASEVADAIASSAIILLRHSGRISTVPP